MQWIMLSGWRRQKPAEEGKNFAYRMYVRLFMERTGLNLILLDIIMALIKEKIQEQITIKEESIMITWKNLDTLDSF